MATWQRRSTLGSLRIIRVTAFGRSSLSSFPLYRAARSCCFLAGDPDRLDWGHGVMPNFASTEFSEVRQEKMSKLAHASTIARRLRCPPRCGAHHTTCSYNSPCSAHRLLSWGRSSPATPTVGAPTFALPHPDALSPPPHYPLWRAGERRSGQPYAPLPPSALFSPYPLARGLIHELRTGGYRGAQQAGRLVLAVTAEKA
jgi:hypothetical protein